MRKVKTETPSSIPICQLVGWFRQSMSVFNQHAIEIEHEGRTICATYSTWVGLVRMNPERGTKTADVGDSQPRALAGNILRQMAQDGKA